jgi:hypothetical protein
MVSLTALCTILRVRGAVSAKSSNFENCSDQHFTSVLLSQPDLLALASKTSTTNVESTRIQAQF